MQMQKFRILDKSKKQKEKHHLKITLKKKPIGNESNSNSFDPSRSNWMKKTCPILTMLATEDQN